MNKVDLLRMSPVSYTHLDVYKRQAEDTATGTKRAVPVRAGTSSVQRQLIQFFSKSFPEVIVQGTEAAVSQKRILLCDVCHFQRQL